VVPRRFDYYGMLVGVRAERAAPPRNRGGRGRGVGFFVRISGNRGMFRDVGRRGFPGGVEVRNPTLA